MARKTNRKPRSIKKKSLEVAERRSLVAQYFLQGRTQREIVNLLGLAHGAGDAMVCTDLAAIKDEWKKSMIRDFDECKGRLLEENRQLRRELWEAWHKSKEENISTSVTAHKIRQGRISMEDTDSDSERMVDARQTTEVSKIMRDGNPVFSNQIMESMQYEAELMGVLSKDGMVTGSSAPPITTFRIHRPDGSVTNVSEGSASATEKTNETNVG